METLNDILDKKYYSMLNNLNEQKSASIHRQPLAKHQRKFQDLIKYYSVSFSNPYTKLVNFDITLPTFAGPLRITTPTLNSSNQVRNTVVNLSNVNISSNEEKLLSMGLKFSPTASNSASDITKLATAIEPTTRKLDSSVQSAVAYEVSDILGKPKSSPKHNLNTCMQKALKSLQKKKKDVKILPADKGNATVILSKQQYDDKILEHLSLSAYKKLDKDPTDSIKRKLDTILKKLLKENKISKSFHDSARVLHPRPPHIYGPPKIHKDGAPIHPIVAFYNSPLSALHKQLSEVLKPLTLSTLRIKDSAQFKEKFHSLCDPEYPYYASLDIKSLYTACDIKLATSMALEKLANDPMASL